MSSRCNIFGYGETTPAPGGGGGGIPAVVVELLPGTGRVATFNNSGSARWSSTGNFNGPDGGNDFAGRTRTNIPAVGPISGYSAPRVGPLVGVFLEAGSPVGLAAPSTISYPNSTSLSAASYSPAIRQVFFIGDGFTQTAAGSLQTFTVPPSASRLVLGIADAGFFNNPAGFYNDNGGGYNVYFSILPRPSPSCSIADVTGVGGPPAIPDGQLTGDDFVAYVAALASGSAMADVTGIGGLPSPPDGLFTGDDFNAYVTAFVAGCP